MNNNKLNKCSFCKYKSTSGCMVTPNSYYCKEANDEYYQYLKGGSLLARKSFRAWDKKK